MADKMMADKVMADKVMADKVMADKVLLIGSGGREHALAWKLVQSPDICHVYVAPGNAATHSSIRISNINLDVNDYHAVACWCQENDIKTVIVGPEDPLANGIVDYLSGEGIPCFGPRAEAAQIEASKHFSKDFMERWKIPTARYKVFSDVKSAQDFILSAPFAALVVKASGLAAGKGVIVASDRTEACRAVQDILQDSKFGAAGSTVVIEELLEGEEISCLAFTDGETVRMMPSAQDHKRLGEGDTGPNTGGMGAYCPCPLVTPADLAMIKTDVLQKTVDGMKAEGKLYQGVLYAGIMLTKDGPKVLEFNCRFGDPETQVLMPLLKTDLYVVIRACINRQLNNVTLEFYDKSAVAVVTVAMGYPEEYNKGMPISGIDQVESTPGVIVFQAGTRLDKEQIVSNGGRVLAVVAMDTSLKAAARKSLIGCEQIVYDGKFFRRDIAQKAFKRCLTYSDSGVSIAAGDALVDSIRTMLASTSRPGCMGDLGMFGGAFDLRMTGYRDPLLVSGTDGVGTKLKVAQLCGVHDTVGVDLVAMCVNDVLCHGAEPLFFLDYFACGKLQVGVAADVVKGVTEGCRQAGCALIGGETAEMPGMYGDGEYDLAGFTVGAVERMDYLPQVQMITTGDHVIGLASSGLHSNGLSLVRRVVEVKQLNYFDKCPFDATKSLGETILTPTQIYVKPILSLLKSTKVKAIAHITGGGLPGNVSRVLPEHLSVCLDAETWNMPNVFKWIAQQGNVDWQEMSCTFNCGIGLVLIVDRDVNAASVCAALTSLGCQAWPIGTVVDKQADEGKVIIKNLQTVLESPISTELQKTVTETTVSSITKKKMKVAILISGSGTNMQSLIEFTQNPANNASSQVVLVISNKPNVGGLTLAQQVGITTKVISHKDHGSREEFDAAVHECLVEHSVDIVCLAGFMRILTGGFVRKWRGRMLNIHPSLLPSFKGHNAHEQVLASRVMISGCTVHFVAEEVDAGAILVQESVPVYPDDTLQTLSDRVKTQEHRAFPRALELLASGTVSLGDDGHITWK